MVHGRRRKRDAARDVQPCLDFICIEGCEVGRKGGVVQMYPYEIKTGNGRRD
jgi:hypothetical protein